MTAPTIPTTGKYRTAIHEAGHAIVADAVARDPRHRPHTITVYGADRPWATSGEALGETAQTLSGANADAVTVYVAGGAALERARDDDPWRGADPDLAQARWVATQMGHTDPGPIIAWAKEYAGRIVHARWDALQLFVQALEGNGWRLGGHEVTDALGWAYAGRVWSRKAADDAMVARRMEIERQADFRRAFDARHAEQMARIEAFRSDLFAQALLPYQEHDDAPLARLWDEVTEKALNIVCPLPDLHGYVPLR